MRDSRRAAVFSRIGRGVCRVPRRKTRTVMLPCYARWRSSASCLPAACRSLSHRPQQLRQRSPPRCPQNRNRRRPNPRRLRQSGTRLLARRMRCAGHRIAGRAGWRDRLRHRQVSTVTSCGKQTLKARPDSRPDWIRRRSTSMPRSIRKRERCRSNGRATLPSPKPSNIAATGKRRRLRPRNIVNRPGGGRNAD